MHLRFFSNLSWVFTQFDTNAWKTTLDDALLGEWRSLPHFEADQGIFNRALVEFYHVGMHVVVVAPDVPLCAAIWNGSKAEGGILFLGLLELGKKQQRKVCPWFKRNLVRCHCRRQSFRPASTAGTLMTPAGVLRCPLETFFKGS